MRRLTQWQAKPLPANRKIDGVDISKLLTGDGGDPPRSEFVHYTSRGVLEGLCQRKWKLLVKKPCAPRRNAKKPQPVRQAQVMLFDLSKDVGEKQNLVAVNPDIVIKLQACMSELDAEIKKNARAPWQKVSE